MNVLKLTADTTFTLAQAPENLHFFHSWVNGKLWETLEPEAYQVLLTDFAIFFVVAIVAAIAYFVAKTFVVSLVKRIVVRSKNSWDDEILNSRLLTFVSLIVPTIIIWKVGAKAFTSAEHASVIDAGGNVVMILLAFLSINSALNVCERIYRRYEISKKFPVKGFIQVVKIVMAICGTVFIISSIIDKSPLALFTGLGAMSAVLMFIFKDSILGLVAGVQLSANRMVARGDWIEVPKFGADGEVLEVALTTVKVRNWDKTITTLPTYALISDSFKNWRGMSASGVRRIMRSITLDMQTIKFVDAAMMGRLKSIKLLDEYLEGKEQELNSWNDEQEVDPQDLTNARVLTNVGTFRAYIAAYLKNHPKISQTETLLVRQLQPSQYGLPIQIYVFSNDNRWIEFEGVQSDIFDHLLSVMAEFDLSVYQRPTGRDFSGNE